MSHKFSGTGVAIVTPFNGKKEVDAKALSALVNHISDGGVEFIVVLGTTGESVTLTKDEKRLVLDTVLETNNGKLPVVLGIGGNNTAEVARQFEQTDLTGVDGILSASPNYNKPTQEGIYQHYKMLDSVSSRPIILYNVPSRTGSNVLPETVLRLAHDCKNIAAVKEASGNLVQAMDIIKGRPDGFKVLSGEDLLTLPMISCGGDGVISVVANAFPKEYSDMVRDAVANKYEAARINHYKLDEITKYLFAEGNPGGIKAALKFLGLMEDDMRLPLVNVSDNTYNALKSLIGNMKLKKGPQGPFK